jgi:hypothetical protein
VGSWALTIAPAAIKGQFGITQDEDLAWVQWSTGAVLYPLTIDDLSGGMLAAPIEYSAYKQVRASAGTPVPPTRWDDPLWAKANFPQFLEIGSYKMYQFMFMVSMGMDVTTMYGFTSAEVSAIYGYFNHSMSTITYPIFNALFDVNIGNGGLVVRRTVEQIVVNATDPFLVWLQTAGAPIPSTNVAANLLDVSWTKEGAPIESREIWLGGDRDSLVQWLKAKKPFNEVQWKMPVKGSNSIRGSDGY